MAEATEQETAPQDTAGVAVSEAELPEAADSGARVEGGQIDILLDTSVQVTARLGEAEANIRDLLQFGPGSVLRLDRKVGEPVDLYIRGIHFATAKMVVVGDQLAVRISEILPSVSDAAAPSAEAEGK